jgi:hypothetical protein
MGGDSALRAIHSLRLEVMTQWVRIQFATHPFADQPSYEQNTELRQYASQAWRNTRQFVGAVPTLRIVDVVQDTIAARLMTRVPNSSPTWGPLNTAYVDERRELFAFAPERLVLTLRADLAARLGADSTIDGTLHARILATVDGWPTTAFLRRSDGLPMMVRFRADEFNDFGLAPWGEHEVEFWYTAWGRIAPGVLLPRQRDVRRVGKPYKRMTVLALTVNPPAPIDSFAVSDSVAAAFLATERRPMWQAPLAGVATMPRADFAIFPPFVGSPGAVRVGGEWVVVETAQAPGAMDLIARWLATQPGGAAIGVGVASGPPAGGGGASWFTARGLPLLVSPGSAPFVHRALGRPSGTTVIDVARWARIGSDSLWLEPVSALDFRGVLAIYSPTHRWLYLPFAGSVAHQPEQSAIIAALEARGLPVELLGSPRTFVIERATTP